MTTEKKKLVIDLEIPFIKGVFEPYADVCYLKGSEINRKTLEGVDGMIIRTRTHCTPALLEGSTISFIGTATAGTDHIDMDYCSRSGIEVAHAKGCNTAAVAQYVLTALMSVVYRQRKKIKDLTLGVIGVGNIGSRVAAMAQALGMKVLLNDPPRALQEGGAGFVSLEALLAKANVISLHVPLQPDTRHLADVSFFELLTRTPIFINTSRGEVVDETALVRFAPKMSAVVLDVWEHEPAISKMVLDMTTLATTHIAGYSVEGKRNATITIARATANFFEWKALKNFSLPTPSVKSIALPETPKGFEEALFLVMNQIFPIFEEDFRLRVAPEHFEPLRSAYTYRRDNSGWALKGVVLDVIPPKVIKALGFGIR
ncbi:MAG: 4-phosphoerythronate dehydrogenase [Bacteroidales bacterium]|nr:4-phosphoerythronate dehydrogenase [Bacteroidales bacterium]